MAQICTESRRLVQNSPALCISNCVGGFPEKANSLGHQNAKRPGVGKLLDIPSLLSALVQCGCKNKIVAPAIIFAPVMVWGREILLEGANRK